MNGPSDWVGELSKRLPPVACKAGRDALERLAQRLERRAVRGNAQFDPPEVSMIRLLPRLGEMMLEVSARNRAILETLSVARSTGNERAAVLEALGQLDTGTDLAADLRALDRHLDGTAVDDRCHLSTHAIQQEWEFLARTVAAIPEPPFTAEDVSACAEVAEEVLAADTNGWPLREAAARLAGACARFEGRAATRQQLLQAAFRVEGEPWVAAAALEAWVKLQQPELRVGGALKPRPMVAEVLEQLLFPSERARAVLPETHLFFRARVVEIAAWSGHLPVLRSLLRKGDPSEHVRLTAARLLARAGGGVERLALRTWLRRAVVADKRCAAAAVLAAMPMEPGPFDADSDPWPALVAELLSAEIDPWLSGVAVQGVLDRCDEGLVPWEAAETCLELWGDGLEHLAAVGEVDTANAAANVRLWLHVQRSTRLRHAWSELSAWVGRHGEGAEARFGSGPVAALAPGELLDVLSLHAAKGLDLSALPLGADVDAPSAPPRGYRVFIGAPAEWAGWRVAHEISHPRPDKRQAFRHTTDRVPKGSLVALSGRMSEVTSTAVPGQRVASATRLDWGPELPPPSLLVAASRRGRLRVRTPAIRYEIDTRGTGLSAKIYSQRSYTEFAGLRARLLQQPGPAAERVYDEALSRRGFTLRRNPALALPFLDAGDVLEHVVALDGNSIPQLAALSAGLGVYWVARSFGRQQVLNRWRAQVPLVIGGWGSRGKSGTERLKAALFHGLGYSVLAKTTGCEAMIVGSIPGGEPTEVYLYRPYDQAAISEQRAVLRMGAGMGVQVLLWECMALNPTFVDIIQDGWMRDDLTTITNTYPDHEDIQGPSGRDVAEVVARFVPRGSTVYTAEQHMAPVLKEEAARKRSRLVVCRPEDWELLPADLLARMPYAEHPRNIALVLRMADGLGVRSDVALRAMADHVVPDMGVLKVYGPVDVDERSVSFINGMSANERAGFESNWARMGLDVVPSGSGLDEHLIVLVNNRSDRLARQEVFANIAALDSGADRIAVIGTNVGPFIEAWSEALHGELVARLTDLAREERGGSRDSLVDELSYRLRRPVLSPRDAWEVLVAHAQLPHDDMKELLTAAYRLDFDADSRSNGLSGVGALFGDECTWVGTVERWLAEVSWLYRLRQSTDWSVPRAIDGAVAVLASRILPMHDSRLSGDQVLDALARVVPRGATVQVLGCSNIKGTGLGFVYRWLSIDRIQALTRELPQANAERTRALLRSLVTHSDYGIPDAEIAVKALQQGMQGGRFAQLGLEMEGSATLGRVQSRLESAAADLARQDAPPVGAFLRRSVRSSLDLRASMQRRADADQLYADLSRHQVGLARAVQVAKSLVEAQKT